MVGGDGEDGEPGAPMAGPQGLKGDPGLFVPGRDGDEGEPGYPIPGQPGRDGAIGPAGPFVPGMDGDEGEPGYPIPGTPGAVGAVGPAGAFVVGQQGDEGEPGYPIPGNAGAPGSAGAQGPAGPFVMGQDGEDGEAGVSIPGPPGPAGSSTQLFVSGYNLSYSSGTAVLVGYVGGTSICADSTNAATITLSGQATVTVTTNGAINGNDSFQGPGTVTSSSDAVTGTSTTFLSSFGTRAGTGTISATASTTITGSGTAFLSQVTLGDLIGNTSVGYFQVTAIASDTSLTIESARTFAGGSSFNVIENPTILVGTRTSNQQVYRITTDTALQAGPTGGLSNQTGVTYKIGVAPQFASVPASSSSWMYLFVGSGASGTGCYASTQRTTPYGVSGYNTYFRRIGCVYSNGSSTSIVQFFQIGQYGEKTYQWEIALASLLGSGTSASWAPVLFNTWAPPTAHFVMFQCGPGPNAFLRTRNIGASALTRNLFVGTYEVIGMTCDGAQAIDYTVQAGGSVSIWPFGFKEQL